MWAQADIDRVVALAAKGVLVISDECYSEMTFAKKHISPIHTAAGLSPNIVVSEHITCLDAST